jgi:N-acetylmuramoyl-L-alanine amidase
VSAHRGLALLAAGVLAAGLVACHGGAEVAPAALPVLTSLEATPTTTAPTHVEPTPARASPTAPAPSPTPEPSLAPGPKQLTVVLDPGHGGPTAVGAAAHGVVEKDSNLEMALRLEKLLVEQGIRVVMTRRSDSAPVGYEGPTAEGGFSAQRLDLQARIDFANAEGGDIFLSIHSNGSTSPTTRGLETWYDPNRPFGDRNLLLARLLQTHVLRELRAYGYNALDRGLQDDTCFRVFNGVCRPLFVLGPPRETTVEEVLRRGGDPLALGFAPGQSAITSRATNMPGALIELLFVSNEQDAAVLRSETGRQAMARGLAAAIVEYFEQTGQR